MQKIRGVHTAIVTPFTSDDQIDEEALHRLIEIQLEAQVDGIVPIGTTGEAPTLTKSEVRRIITLTKSQIKQDSLLIVGTGSYATTQAIENTQQAYELGADAALIVTPHYNRPSQEGLFLHFKAIAEATPLPIILYNVPHRSCVNLHIDTLKRLMEIPSIIGIKEASGSMQQMEDIVEAVKRMRPDFSVLSGDDSLLLPLMSIGGDGVISVLSNLLPIEIKELYEAAAARHFILAQEIHNRLISIIKAAFIETNPIPIKAALAMCGLIHCSYRLPLCNLSPENNFKLSQVIQEYSRNYGIGNLVLGCQDK